MIFLTHLPDFVAIIFRGLPGVWKNRHKLIFCWFVYSQALHLRNCKEINYDFCGEIV